jgi:hypothetical protein
VRAVVAPRTIDLQLYPTQLSIGSLNSLQSAVSGGTTWYWVNNKWYRIVSTGGGSMGTKVYNVISNDGSSLKLVATGGGN